MQGTKKQEILPAIVDVLTSFRAVIHQGDAHIHLRGPDVLYTYEAPERGVEQGIMVTFRAGDVPMIAMLLEKQGDKVDCRAARLADERLEIFHGGQMFSDLANNYVDQPLWPSEAESV